MQLPKCLRIQRQTEENSLGWNSTTNVSNSLCLHCNSLRWGKHLKFTVINAAEIWERTILILVPLVSCVSPVQFFYRLSTVGRSRPLIEQIQFELPHVDWIFFFFLNVSKRKKSVVFGWLDYKTRWGTVETPLLTAYTSKRSAGETVWTLVTKSSKFYLYKEKYTKIRVKIDRKRVREKEIESGWEKWKKSNTIWIFKPSNHAPLFPYVLSMRCCINTSYKNKSLSQ